MRIEAPNNIFLALGKYNSAVDENYLTEAFVFLLNFLLENDRSLCIEILRKLCIKDSDYYFAEDEAITICTQVFTEQGRPDIRISSPDKLIYVEVKHESGLGENQIERYQNAVNSSNAPIKKVILLTKFSVDFGPLQGEPYKHVRWYEVASWLLNLKHNNPVAGYFIKTFLEFMEVKNMTVQKVSWEYINGFNAFWILINMIAVAIESEKFRSRRTSGWDWTGFYFDDSKRIFCGIYHNDPLSVVMQTTDSKTEDKVIFNVALKLEDVHFFSLSKDEQLEVITKFVKEKYIDAKKHL